MSKLTDNLLAPNLWVGIFSLLGLFGIVAMLTGHKTVGLCLMAPLFLGAVVLVCVVIPILIVKNKSEPKD